MPPPFRWLTQIVAFPFFVLGTLVVWGFTAFAAWEGDVSFYGEARRATFKLWRRWRRLFGEDEQEDHRFG